MTYKHRPFLKWPGGKYRVMDKIINRLPKGSKLVEPFVGGGSVFLNTDYPEYLLNDANQDLINLYKVLKDSGNEFIVYAKSFFGKRYNNKHQYYKIRDQFNNSDCSILRSALFLYLNRHGYNGLIRYCQSKGHFNVPFGLYNEPYFPEKEMLYFAKKSKNAKFVCEDFAKTMKRVKLGDVVYCDPPYISISKTANFTSYQPGGFVKEDQIRLKNEAELLSKKGIKVLLSNHDTDVSRDIYKNASITSFNVSRTISCKGDKRNPVKELLALFE